MMMTLASRQIRLSPEASSSSSISESRSTVSPSEIPPTVVVTMSLVAGGLGSPNSSHIMLPARVTGAEPQKERPLARPMLKYTAPA